MKTLATCKPSEFLKQTNRIKKAAEKWLTETDLLNIRKRLPDTDGLSDEDALERMRKQARENAGAMLDEILDKHPEETLELLALLCFIEPEDVDNHPVSEYLQAFTELITNEAVLSFFYSLERWGLTNTPAVSRE